MSLPVRASPDPPRSRPRAALAGRTGGRPAGCPRRRRRGAGNGAAGPRVPPGTDADRRPGEPMPPLEFAGDFETHLTLDAATPERVERAALWAAEHGLKFTHIELDAGETPSQPMVTYHGHGTLTGELAVARNRADRLAAAGLPVLRTKIEAAPADHGVPADRAAAEALPEWCYFEHHVKLLL